MDIFHFNISMHFLPFFFTSSSSSFSFSSLSFFHFLSLIFNLLFLITSSSDVHFLIRLFLLLTHSTDFRKTASDNQILHFVLHIFLRTMSGSMKESLYFLWLDYTFIGALKPVLRSVFLILLLYSGIFSIYWVLIDLHAIKFK